MKPAGWLTAAALLAMLLGCGRNGSHEPRPDWVIHSKLAFFKSDMRRERRPAPLEKLRLWFPYLSGDLYGAPTTGASIEPAVDARYGFDLDLNQGHEGLLKALEPTKFSRPGLRIEPADARIARLLPFVMEKDGIEPIGATGWLDVDARERLMLVYVDRPARIIGTVSTPGHKLNFDVAAEQSGYIWITESVAGDSINYRAIARPSHIVLAVTPKPR